MQQNGADDEGILGFLPEDIKKIAAKHRNDKCFYCAEKSATILCRNTKCRRMFHQICGHQNKCSFEFSGDFRAFCHAHVEKHEFVEMKIDFCPSCLEELNQQDYDAVRWIPSCECNSAYMHLECMRKWALAAGYFFKCVCSRQSEEYSDLIRSRGVFVPMEDAKWETTRGAYNSMYQLRYECEADECVCPNGRGFNRSKRNSRWYLKKCSMCGSNTIHNACRPEDAPEAFICSACNAASLLEASTSTASNAQKRSRSSPERVEDVDVDAFSLEDNFVFARVPAKRQMRSSELVVAERGNIPAEVSVDQSKMLRAERMKLFLR